MAIELRNIVRSYEMGTETVFALNGVSLKVENNEYVAITGQSGSGKSTLMNIIGCLDSPTSGEYFLDGERVSEMDDDQLSEIRNKKIGFLFQTFDLLARSDVFHNVELPLIYGNINASGRKIMAEEAIEKVGLSDRITHKPNELSGGQRQRAAIARALAGNPSILLADEPTGNLDSATSEEIMALFDSLHKAGNTILVITHEADIAAHTQRIVRLKDGLIESDEKVKKR